MTSRWKSVLRWSAPGKEQAGAAPTLKAGDGAGADSTGDGTVAGQWSGGSRLLTRVAAGALIAGIVCGPIALVTAGLVLVTGTSSATATQTPPADHANEQAAVQEFAQRYLQVWLETPAGQEQRLAPYVQVDDLSLPKVAVRAAGFAVAGVTRVAPGRWSLIVAATVTTAKPVHMTREYFQVPVRYSGAELVAEALPAPVAAPTFADPPDLAYGNQLDPAGPAGAAAGGFLTALLTGAADVTRFESPGSTVAPLTSTPYSAITIVTVASAEDLSGSATPAPAARAHVLVTATATLAADQQLTVQYPLTLQARAGRWEVQSLDPAPLTTTPIVTATTSASISTAPPSSR